MVDQEATVEAEEVAVEEVDGEKRKHHRFPVPSQPAIYTGNFLDCN